MKSIKSSVNGFAKQTPPMVRGRCTLIGMITTKLAVNVHLYLLIYFECCFYYFYECIAIIPLCDLLSTFKECYLYWHGVPVLPAFYNTHCNEQLKNLVIPSVFIISQGATHSVYYCYYFTYYHSFVFSRLIRHRAIKPVFQLLCTIECNFKYLSALYKWVGINRS